MKTVVTLHGGWCNLLKTGHDGSGIIQLPLCRTRDGTMTFGMAIYEVNSEGTEAFWSHNTWAEVHK